MYNKIIYKFKDVKMKRLYLMALRTTLPGELSNVVFFKTKKLKETNTLLYL